MTNQNPERFTIQVSFDYSPEYPPMHVVDDHGNLEKNSWEPRYFTREEARKIFHHIDENHLRGQGFKNQVKNTVSLMEEVVTARDDDGDPAEWDITTVDEKTIEWSE